MTGGATGDSSGPSSADQTATNQTAADQTAAEQLDVLPHSRRDLSPDFIGINFVSGVEGSGVGTRGS